MSCKRDGNRFKRYIYTLFLIISLLPFAIAQQSLGPQRFGVGGDELGLYYELNDTSFGEEEGEDNESSLAGELLVQQDDFSDVPGFYVRLDDLVDGLGIEEGLIIDFSEAIQDEIQPGMKVDVRQTLTVTNTNDETKSLNLNLYNYPEKALLGADSIAIMIGQEIYSEQPMLFTELGPFESKEFTINYEFPPVEKNINCRVRRISDMIPSDAIVTRNDLPFDTVIGDVCDVKISHSGKRHYFDIILPLEGMDPERIKSVYYVEGGEYLEIMGQTVMLPGEKRS